MATADGKKTGGRVAGTPNKSTSDIKALAQQYTDTCIEALGKIVANVDHPQRVQAIKELLDRGYGRAPQSIDQRNTGEIVIHHKYADDWRKPGQ